MKTFFQVDQILEKVRKIIKLMIINKIRLKMRIMKKKLK